MSDAGRDIADASAAAFDDFIINRGIEMLDAATRRSVATSPQQGRDVMIVVVATPAAMRQSHHAVLVRIIAHQKRRARRAARRRRAKTPGETECPARRNVPCEASETG